MYGTWYRCVDGEEKSVLERWVEEFHQELSISHIFLTIVLLLYSLMDPRIVLHKLFYSGLIVY